MTESTDPYLYPGTDVLRNLRDIRDLDILARFEAEATARRLIEALGAGYYLSEINAIHPFREGNGRVQREFVRGMGLQVGFAIDWSHITRDQTIDASRESFQTGDSTRLSALVAKAML